MQERNLISNCNQRVVVVAEIGNNHEGDLGAARELVQAAAECGVDAVKFQHFVPSRYVVASDTERRARLAKFALSNDQILDLFELARSLGLVPFATGFDRETLCWLIDHQQILKIASGDNNFTDLIFLAGQSGKPTIISLGLLEESEILTHYAQWQSSCQSELILLHCVSSYPALSSDLNLAVISRLQDLLPGVLIGYSDHSIGSIASLVATALGARMIEKHFTLSHSFSDFRDHQLSATPSQLKVLVSQIREIESSLGDGIKIVGPRERANETAMRRSAAANRDLRSGHIIKPDDIIFLRPGSGTSPVQIRDLIGRTIVRNVSEGSIISSDDLLSL